MIKVFLTEKSQSEVILIKSFLPEYCVAVTIPESSETLRLFGQSPADAVIAGPSVPYPERLRLARAVAKAQGGPVFITLSRQAAPEHPPGGSAGMGLKFPEGLGSLKDILTGVMERRLKTATSPEERYLRDRMSLLVGESAAVAEVKAAVLRYSTAPGPVLITGESGTGKEIAAKLLHDFSYRKNRIYHALNAGSIPSGLSESELFGVEPGAYTGAVRRKGCFEHADGGTLFLDEIGELDKNVQTELLRVLENGCVRRVGGNELIKTDVRLVSATNRNLFEQVRDRTFRKDLLFRINMFQIPIPPLRERKEDIPSLLMYFSERLRKDRPDKCFEFSDSFLECLYEHSWPGNVRELRNVFHRAVYASDSQELTADSLIFDPLEPAI